MITLKQLRVFTSIARQGNLTLAADELCLSKGAVSQALGELERRLGTPLFDRIHPRLQLNEQGRQLRPLAEDILSRSHNLLHFFDSDTAPRGTLRIGASQTIGNYLLPKLLSGLPDVEARVHIQSTHQLCEMLANFALDIALIEGDNHHSELYTEEWREHEMLIVAHPDHPLAKRKVPELSHLQGENWVLREPLSGNREQFELLLANHVYPQGKIVEFNTLEAVIQGVEQGLGLTFISQLAINDRLQEGRLVTLDVNQRFDRQLRFSWHRQKYQSPLMQLFIRHCKNATH